MNDLSAISGILFFWAGFVCSISFMESWLKFRAKGVTTNIGVSIGSVIFTALNRMEWIFFLVLFLMILFKKALTSPGSLGLLFILLLILIIQTFFLLPNLVQRANWINEGKVPPKTKVHIFYIALESVKVIVLLTAGILLLS